VLVGGAAGGGGHGGGGGHSGALVDAADRRRLQARPRTLTTHKQRRAH